MAKTVTCTGGAGASVSADPNGIPTIFGIPVAANGSFYVVNLSPTVFATPTSIAIPAGQAPAGATVKDVSVTIHSYSALNSADSFGNNADGSFSVGLLLTGPNNSGGTTDLELLRCAGSLNSSYGGQSGTFTLVNPPSGGSVQQIGDSNSCFGSDGLAFVGVGPAFGWGSTLSGTYAIADYGAFNNIETEPNYHSLGALSSLIGSNRGNLTAPGAGLNVPAPVGSSTFAVFSGALVNEQTWALYLASDPDFYESIKFTSWDITITYSEAPSTTIISTSVPTAFSNYPNNTVILTSTVTSGATGNITFQEGMSNLNCAEGNPVTLTGGFAQCTLTYTSGPAGYHSYSAIYSGDSIFDGSTSNTPAAVFVYDHATNSGNQYCNNTPFSTDGASPFSQYPSVIYVGDGTPGSPSINAPVQTVSVELQNLASANTTNMEMLLVAPNGTNAFQFWGCAGSGSTEFTGNYTLQDGSPQLFPLIPGAYGPADFCSIRWPSPSPSPSPQIPATYGFATPTGSATFASSFSGNTANGPWSLFIQNQAGSGNATSLSGWCLNITPIPTPLLSVSMSHTGAFTQGHTGELDITVSNTTLGTITSGTTNFVVTLPAGYFFVSDSGGSWSCHVTPTVSCSSTQSVPGGSSFPVLQLFVLVPPNSPASVSNTASAWGGGDLTHTNLGTAAVSNTDTVTVVQVPTSITVTSGSGQSAFINTQFTNPLVVTVTDAGGNPVPNAQVTFTAPAQSGPSATFAGGTTVTTNSSGVASAAITANGNVGGPYTVSASVIGVSTPANFSLTNTVPPPFLSVAKTHTTLFTQGRTAEWQIIVSNASGHATTSGTTTLSDTLPMGYTLASTFLSDWSCSGTTTVSCTSTQAVAGGGNFETLVLVVNVPSTSATSVSNTASAWGGGDTTHTAQNTAAVSNLDTVTVAQAPASISINGTQVQSANDLNGFGSLAVTLKDAGGAVIANYSPVVFTATNGSTGQSGTFSNSSNTISISTNGSGIANPGIFTANTKLGSYMIGVTAGSATATFNLTNTLGPPTHIVVTNGSGQSTFINTPFANPLVATVTDAGGNPVPNALVTFTAPAQSGPSLTFAGGTTTATTNSSGVATSAAIAASGNIGAYSVTASVSGVGSQATFSLSNLTPPFPTTTTLTASPTSPVSGKPVTITATVSSSGPTPTGTVVFTDLTTSTTLSSNAPVTSGVATVTSSTLTPGSHSILAVYFPTGDFGGSNGSTTVTISRAGAIAPAGTGTSLTGAELIGPGIFRSSNGLWLLDSNYDNKFDTGDKVFLFAGNGLTPQSTDIAVAGDWNGSGTTKIGLYRPSTGTWFLDYDGNGVFDGPGVDRQYQYGGLAGDIPVVGDWNGSGVAKIGIFRQGFQWLLNLSGNGTFSGGANDAVFAFGGATGCTGSLPGVFKQEPAGSCDIPVVGDWNRSGTTKVGVVRAEAETSQPFLWILDTSGQQMYIATGPQASTVFAFGGISGDVPLVGDWTDSAKTNVGVFRAGFEFVEDTTASLPAVLPAASDTLVAFPFGGIAGDQPVVGHWQ